MEREAALRALRVRTPRLELRLPTRAELLALAEVARAGIHPPERTPFYVPWTDAAQEPGFADDFAAFHESRLAEWTESGWSLELVAFLERRPVGVQALRRTGDAVDTGSWLGGPWQNRGLGVEMRSGVLELAFRLGYDAATSGAFVDNPQSQRVSEKLGYRRVGTATHAPRGAPVREILFRLERADWRCPVPVELEGVEAARPFLSP
jgi:RimJ/RimL family protein N-acetyltransferase